jgi:hypothetical protein
MVTLRSFYSPHRALYLPYPLNLAAALQTSLAPESGAPENRPFATKNHNNVNSNLYIVTLRSFYSPYRALSLPHPLNLAAALQTSLAPESGAPENRPFATTNHNNVNSNLYIVILRSFYSPHRALSLPHPLNLAAALQTSLALENGAPEKRP